MAHSGGTSKAVLVLTLAVLGYFGSLHTIGIEGKTLGQQCVAPEVAEGQTGVMIFYIRRDINFSSDQFFANLVRTHEPDWDILKCEQKQSTPVVDCDVHSDHYQCKGVEHHSLVVLIPDITKNFQDTYIFQAYVNSTPEPPDFCKLSVKQKDVPTGQLNPTNGSATYRLEISIAIIVILAVVLICVIIFFKRIRMFMCAREQNEPSQIPLLKKGTTHTQMRWYFKDITPEEEKELLKFQINGPGSFLVRVSRTNKTQHVLAVNFEGDIKYLTLIPHKNGWKFPSTGHIFTTMCKAIDYYKTNDIIVNGKPWGRLLKPFEQEPQKEWYFGKLAAEHETRLLLSGQSKPTGSFLIAVTDYDPYAFCLMVKTKDGKMCHVAIIPNETGLVMVDTTTQFKTLSKIIEHLQENEIRTSDKETVTLTESFSKDPFKGWYFETCTDNDWIILSQSKRIRHGSFIITKDINRENGYLLKVYFDGEIKSFPVTQDRSRFLLHTAGAFFHSWYELVDFYRKHELKAGEQILGTLQKPLRPEPKEDWYFGPLTTADERKLLLLPTKSAGTFLIRDSVTDPDNYTLSINQGDTIHQHEIIDEDTGYKIMNTNKAFDTLDDLVKHYSEKDLELDDGTNSGTLREPCSKDPPGEWYFETFTAEDEAIVLKKAQPGSFLITCHPAGPDTFSLKVYIQKEITKFRVQRQKNGIKFLLTGKFFYTWNELVDYYRKHNIQVNERVFGKLVTPLRKEFKEEWYFGRLAEEAVEKLLLMGRNGPGTFLIRESNSSPENCVLTVNYDGQLKHFRIIPGERGFTLRNTDIVRPTLAELVEYYKENEISVDESTYEKLTSPFKVQQQQSTFNHCKRFFRT